MEVLDFCRFLFELREKHISRLEMERKYPWHRNTIKGYEKDRLPDVDFLYAVAVETGYDYKELVSRRLKVGVLQNQFDFEVDTVFGENEPKKKEGITFVINDESMAPTILYGALVNIDDQDTQLRQGKIFALKMNGVTTVRRIQFGLKNDVILITDNPSLTNLTIPFNDSLELCILGRVTRTSNPL